MPAATTLHSGLFDLERMERLPVGTGTPLIGRDSYVTELSIKLDQLQAEFKSLRRDLELAKGDIAELREETERSTRLYTFQEKEQRSRALKIEDMQRRFSEMKSRLDQFTSFGSGNFTAYNSFESVSRRLTELSATSDNSRTWSASSSSLQASSAAPSSCGSSS